MNTQREQEIVDKLLAFAKSLDDHGTDFLLALDSEERQLIADIENTPHAFVIGCVLDRRVPAEKAWAAPYKLKERIGSFSFSRLRQLTPDDWEKYLGKQDDDPECIHINWRNVTQGMPLCLHSAMQAIDRYSDGSGDAKCMWTGDGLRGDDIVNRFKQIRGVGDKIANMAVRILVTRFKQPIKRNSIDVSVDVHVARVFPRLGLVHVSRGMSTKEKKNLIVEKARELYPCFPAKIDRPIFMIGKQFCHKTKPNCGGCPMKRLCDHAKASRK